MDVTASKDKLLIMKPFFIGTLTTSFTLCLTPFFVKFKLVKPILILFSRGRRVIYHDNL